MAITDWSHVLTEGVPAAALIVSLSGLWRAEHTFKKNDMRTFLESSEIVVHALCGQFQVVRSQAHRRQIAELPETRKAFMDAFYANSAQVEALRVKAERWRQRDF
jgi:hypothetical protein